MQLVLLRKYNPTGVNGELWYNNKLLCYTIELPWRENLRSKSCIPEGVYALKKRYSKRFKHHIILENVADRDYILIHPANYAQRDLRGCIGPVSKLTAVGKGSESKKAMAILKGLVYNAIEKGQDVFLKIKERT